MTQAEQIVAEAGGDVSAMISIVGPQVLPQSIGVDFSYYEFADDSVIVYTEDPDGMEAVVKDEDAGGYNISQAVGRLSKGVER